MGRGTRWSLIKNKVQYQRACPFYKETITGYNFIIGMIFYR